MNGTAAIGLAAVAGLAACLQAAATPPSCEPPLDRLVTNRPRLFINAQSLPLVIRAASQEHGERLNALRDIVNRLTTDADLPPGDYGVESAAAAFLLLSEPTPARLTAATGLLERSVAYYRDCDRDRRTVSRYSATRIHAIMAYDWIYDAMPTEQRFRLGRDLLAHVAFRVLERSVPGDNLGDSLSGFYGEISLPWYVGLATIGTGIDEDKSVAAIVFGYDQHRRMLDHRRRLAGDDGGGGTATLGYALGADPWAEWNFFHTMESAFGVNAATNWPHAALLPNYVLWNRLPGGLEFGSGDAFHTSNEWPDGHLYAHLAHVRHFFGASHPEQAALAAWLQPQCRPPVYSSAAWPLAFFFLNRINRSPPPHAPPPGAPLARHFEGMGQVFMRSGWGDRDTYALFTAGGSSARHKHFDENTFTIFHQGYLALDSGTRPEPGSHLFQYYCRSVAHNGILIRMEGEQMPAYWGTPAPGEPDLPIANDGGMRCPTGAVIRAFHTTPDFTYIASDATACYHPAKCRLALRQFVHVQPNFFVIFDRVHVLRADQPVTWLLHTAEQPILTGDRFRADHRGGRLWCRTLLPAKGSHRVVGGPGREFWSDGRNWPLPAKPWLGGETIKHPELLGGWRVEVSPSTPALKVRLLHVIEVGARAASNDMAAVRRLWSWNWTGVELRQGERKVSVRFRKNGEPGCDIAIRGSGRRLTATLGNTVQRQSALTAGR